LNIWYHCNEVIRMPSVYIGYYYKKKFENFIMKTRHAHDDIEIMYVS